jgi:alpha-glucosidase
MVAGPMDYIPGTMNNAQKNDFRKNGDHPMGQGTRAHAIALFGILESPMQMLPDAPSDYYKERECMEFISRIPVEWDETIVLEAKVGDYVVIARRNGSGWIVSAITDWQPRDFVISLDFLDDGDYDMELIKDGINADLRALDYVLERTRVNKKSRLELKLAPGGGWIASINKK